MIDFYGMGSPNVLKVAIMLEEVGRPYQTHAVSVLKGENFDPAFLALNPIAKVPVIVDHEGPVPGQTLFESGAILMYLAETYKPELLPRLGPARWEVLMWLNVQVSLVGPMLGQVNHFHLLPSEANSYAAGRYRDQAARAYRNIDERLQVSPFLGGEFYSIADIATYPWMGYLQRHGFEERDFPHLIAWRNALDTRPSVKRAAAAFEELAAQPPAEPPTDHDLDRFFAREAPGPKVDLVSYFNRGPMFTAKGDRDAAD